MAVEDVVAEVADGAVVVGVADGADGTTARAVVIRTNNLETLLLLSRPAFTAEP